MMKLRFVLPMALLVLALAGCKGGGEAAVVGKWKSEMKIDSSKSDDPAAKMAAAFASMMTMDLEMKADHKYKMTIMSMMPIEGDWSMSGNQVTLTPRTIMGMSPDQFIKEQKAKNPGSMAATSSDDGSKPMNLELQSDGKTMKPSDSKAKAQGVDLIFTKQQ